MGINVKVQKSPKPIEIITAEARLERDLKSCMRCRYFHGNNRQCIAKKCVKEEKKQPENPKNKKVYSHKNCKIRKFTAKKVVK